MTLSSARAGSVLGDRVDVADALGRCHAAALESVDPSLLALIEARITELLGQAKAPAHSERGELEDTERACIAFAEQWVVDVASMSDELVADVSARLGSDGFVDFVHALLVVEQRLRLDIAWRRLGFST